MNRLKRRPRPTICEKYDLLGQIGQGTYGVVYKAKMKNSEDTKEYAIKKFKSTPESEGLSQSACREIMLCRELQNENVVSLLEVILDPAEKSIAMVFPYAEHDLLQILEFYREKKTTTESKLLPRNMVKSLLWQILSGVHYLHSNWVLHRDLKPANILIMGDGPEKGCVKIADLGLARLFQSPLQPLYQADRVVVTIWYRSPELLLGAKHYTKAIDVWSVGCIFAELIMGYGLFKGREVKAEKNNRNPFQNDQLEKIFDYLGVPNESDWLARDLPEAKKLATFDRKKYPKRTLEQAIGEKISRNGFALLKRMLDYNPNERITTEEALAHEYFKEPQVSMNIFEGDPTIYPKRVVVLDDNVKKEIAEMEKASQQKKKKIKT